MKGSHFSAISSWEQAIYRWDAHAFYVVLDQHAEFIFDSVSSLKH